MTLRTRLLLFVALATLVPTVLLGIRFSQDRAKEIDSALISLAVRAGNIANDLDEKVQGTAQLHFGLERARDLENPNKADCSAFLSAVREEYPQYTGILTINPDGRLFCDSLQTNRSLDLNDREYFKKALVTTNAVTLQPAVGRLTGTSVLQIAYPARSESGLLKFVLLASFNLQKFAAFHNQRISNSMDIFLVDKSGIVLVPPQSMNWSSPIGSSIAQTDIFRFAETQLAGNWRFTWPLFLRCGITYRHVRDRLHAAWLFGQNHAQQRAMDFEMAVVRNEAKITKLIHEMTYARPGRADHLSERLLADLR